MYTNTSSISTKPRLTQLTRLTAIAGSAAIAALLGSPSFGVAPASDTYTPFEHQCFIEQPHWNVALDGPVPRCPGPLAAQEDTPSAMHTHAAVGGDVIWVGGLARAR